MDITTQSELTYLNCEGNLLSMLNIAQNKLIDTLMISEMPRLTEVCVWSETFPPAGVYVDSFHSGNAYFTYLCECVGDLLEENDSYEEPVHIDTGQEYSDLFVSVNDDDWYIFHISNYFTDAKIHFDVNQFNGKIQADLWNEYPYPWGNPVNPILSSPISSENDLLELVLRPGEYWLRISSDSGSATAYSLNIDASSHPEVYSDPQSLTFEDANIYSTHTQKLTIGNQGTQELLIDSIHNTLLGSKISPATAAIRPGKVQEFTMEVFPRTLKEFSGELHFFMSNPSYGDMEIPVSGNGFLSRSVVILKEIIDTVSMGYWKARELKFPNYSADFILKLTQSAITYFLPEQKHDHILQPDSIAGTWVYTTLEGITVIPRKEDKNFWLVLDATDLQNGDYYADVVFEWYNPNYYKGFIPVILHVKDTIVSIPSAREPAGLVLYPNPTTGYLMIEVGEDDSYDVLITKLEGHLVYRSHMQGKTHELDLSCFQKGVYFITIRSKDFVTTRKIVKL